MGNPPIHGNFDGEYDDELWDFEGGSQYFQTSSLLITYMIIVLNSLQDFTSVGWYLFSQHHKSARTCGSQFEGHSLQTPGFGKLV